MLRSDDVRIEKCARCAGSGHVVGTSQWQVPVSAWADSPEAMEREPLLKLLKPRMCDACNGSGTMVFTDAPRVKRSRYQAMLIGA